MTYDGVASAALAKRLRTPSCLSLVRVTSTLDVVHELAREGAPAHTVVLADEQVAGRGRHGREWQSPPGMGIWLGYLFQPSGSIDGGVVALRVGMAIVDALGELGATPRLKWPNDVLVNGRKVAGVLCEARWQGPRLRWIAIGVGINVHGPLPADLAARAIVLDEVVPHVNRVSVLEHLVPKLHRLDDAPRLTKAEREMFDRLDSLAGRAVRSPVVGTVEGVAADGALLVGTANGTKRVLGGSVVPA